ncbi:DUF6491 family protein [Hyphococcus flavus]|uniref:DUF6491 family protein n=1 Tax=Hyphococcus flavus TaxID=1866326 RepID=UPI003B75C61F
MKKLTISGLATIFAVCGCATASSDEASMSERAAKRLAQFELTGESRNCLSTTQIRSITPLDDKHFLISGTGGRYYLNEVSGRCYGASRSANRIQYTTSTGQLCRNQIISVVGNTSGIFGGSCGLSDFQELRRKSEQ